MITSNTKIKGLFAIFSSFGRLLVFTLLIIEKKLKPLILTLEANSFTHFCRLLTNALWYACDVFMNVSVTNLQSLAKTRVVIFWWWSHPPIFQNWRNRHNALPHTCVYLDRDHQTRQNWLQCHRTILHHIWKKRFKFIKDMNTNSFRVTHDKKIHTYYSSNDFAPNFFGRRCY